MVTTRNVPSSLISRCVLICLLGVALTPLSLSAQDIVVSQAIPDNAPQGMVNRDVQVKGKGFKKGAKARWYVTGTTDPGGVTVNSTTYVSSTELIANINVAADAQTQKKFDIAVTLSNGRTGKGIELFSVTVSSPDPAIAYVAVNRNHDTLMVMNADGSHKQVVIPGQKDIFFYNPNWSPDGTQLVFGSNIQGKGIYVVNLDGTGLRKVVATVSDLWSPVWSPAPAADGQFKIAFSDRATADRQDYDLFLVNLDGMGLQNLTNTVGPGEFHPTWDPYATRLAANDINATQSDLVVYQLGLVGGSVGITSQMNLTESGPLQDAQVHRPDWAKTQDKLAVVVFPPGEVTFDIWVIDLADFLNPVNLTRTSDITENHPSWSPDDTRIVFRRKNAKNKVSIFVMNADGSGVQEIGNPLDEDQHEPDWRRCCPTCATMCAP